MQNLQTTPFRGRGYSLPRQTRSQGENEFQKQTTTNFDPVCLFSLSPFSPLLPPFFLLFDLDCSSSPRRQEECTSYFTEQPEWVVGDDTGGRLLCPNPKCQSRVGTWKWDGLQCSCGFFFCFVSVGEKGERGNMRKRGRRGGG